MGHWHSIHACGMFINFSLFAINYREHKARAFDIHSSSFCVVAKKFLSEVMWLITRNLTSYVRNAERYGHVRWTENIRHKHLCLQYCEPFTFTRLMLTIINQYCNEINVRKTYQVYLAVEILLPFPYNFYFDAFQLLF